MTRQPARKHASRAGRRPTPPVSRVRASPRRAAPRLSRAVVVDAAIGLLGSEGLDGVSLRRLASGLGVRAPSLYWHFPDKAALLGAMMEKIFLDCVDNVPRRSHWQRWMGEFADVLWRTQESVRDFGRLLLSTPMNEVQIDRIEAHLATRLVGLDIPQATALRIQSSVQVLVTGWFLFAHTQFSPALSRKLDFRARMESDLALLLEGEARKLRTKRR